MATGKDTRVDVRVFPAGDPNPGDVRVRGGEVAWSDVFLTSTAGSDVVVDPGGSIVAPIVVESGPGATEELTATSAGTATTSGMLTRVRGFTVTTSGAATSTATLSRFRGFTVTSAGTSTSNGTITRVRGLSGTTVGTSATTGELSEYENMAGVSAGGSVSDAGLSRTLALTATSAGSGVSAAIRLDVDGDEPPAVWSPAISTPGVGDIAALQFMLRDAAQEEELAAAYVAALVLL